MMQRQSAQRRRRLRKKPSRTSAAIYGFFALPGVILTLMVVLNKSDSLYFLQTGETSPWFMLLLDVFFYSAPIGALMGFVLGQQFVRRVIPETKIGPLPDTPEQKMARARAQAEIEAAKWNARH